MQENKTEKRNLPRDLFLHLLAIVALYWSSISFVTLLWQYINYFYPDLLNYYISGINSSMRFAISSLIIVFPVFILTSWYLNKIYSKESQVRESKIRKWLIYLTLFIASLVIIGDLVAVINIFLSGEITARFVLKALSILFVAAVIFGYYLDDVRKESPTKLGKPFAYGTSSIVLLAVIGSFFIIGSPQFARELQLDQQKVYDLQNIQSQIVFFFQSKQRLPNNLEELNDPISGFEVPKDPNEEDYVYNIKNGQTLTFELCATFNRESQNDNSTVRPLYPAEKGLNQNWSHPSGSHCFERTIDRDLYPPITK